MNNVTTELGAVIDTLAERLMVPVTELYGILVRQAQVEAIKCGVFLALALVVVVSFGVETYLFYIRRDACGDSMLDRFEYNRGEILIMLATATHGVLALVCLICGAIWMGNMIDALANPEYYALRQLFELM